MFTVTSWIQRFEEMKGYKFGTYWNRACIVYVSIPPTRCFVYLARLDCLVEIQFNRFCFLNISSFKIWMTFIVSLNLCLDSVAVSEVVIKCTNINKQTFLWSLRQGRRYFRFRGNKCYVFNNCVAFLWSKCKMGSWFHEFGER